MWNLMGLCNSITLILWKMLLLEPHQIIDVAYYSELFSLAVYPVCHQYTRSFSFGLALSSCDRTVWSFIFFLFFFLFMGSCGSPVHLLIFMDLVQLGVLDVLSTCWVHLLIIRCWRKTVFELWSMGGGTYSNIFLITHSSWSPIFFYFFYLIL